jgi:hypothetical protein
MEPKRGVAEMKPYVSPKQPSCRKTETLVLEYDSFARHGREMVLTAPVIGKVLVFHWTLPLCKLDAIIF